MTNEEIIKLVLETTGIKGLAELGEQAFKTAEALEKVGHEAEKVKAKTLDLQALASQGAGIWAAFQAGEIPGIVKGVGELVDLVPALNSFAPAIKKVGEVSEYAWPMLKDLWEQAKAPEKQIETAVEKLADYGERIDELGNSVKNFTDRTAAENVQLEREAKALEDSVKQIEKLNALKSTAAEEEEEEIKRQNKLRAEKLKAALGGQQEDIIEDLALQKRAKELAEVTDEYDKMTKAVIKHPELMDVAAADKLNARKEALEKGIPADIQEKARAQVAKAMIGGDEKEVADLAESLDKKGKFRGKILDNADLSDEEMLSPTQKKAKAEADRIAKEAEDAVQKGLARDADAEQKRRADQALKEATERQKRADKIPEIQAKQAAAQAKRHEKTQHELGPEFMAQAEQAMMAADPRERVAVMSQINQAARQRLVQKGATPFQAQMSTMDLGAQLQGDMSQKLRQMGLKNNRSGQEQLFQALTQLVNDMGAMSQMQVTQAQQLQAVRQGIRGNINATSRTQQNNGSF